MGPVGHILLGIDSGPLRPPVPVRTLINSRLRISSLITGNVLFSMPPTDCLTVLKRVLEMDVTGQLSFAQRFVDRVLSLIKNDNYGV
jgi:hypothetical protein